MDDLTTIRAAIKTVVCSDCEAGVLSIFLCALAGTLDSCSFLASSNFALRIFELIVIVVAAECVNLAHCTLVKIVFGHVISEVTQPALDFVVALLVLCGLDLSLGDAYKFEITTESVCVVIDSTFALNRLADLAASYVRHQGLCPVIMLAVHDNLRPFASNFFNREAVFHDFSFSLDVNLFSVFYCNYIIAYTAFEVNIK